MIQGVLGERKISIPFPSPTPSSSSSPITCPSATPILTTTSTMANNSSINGGSNNNSENNNTQNLRCPRCDSTNTKFCYYNNYNLTQPRHFCKTCRRYWTKGGTLRNVPIGGGCRKNRSTTTSASGSSSTTTSGVLKSSSSNAMAKAKASLSTEILINGNPDFLGSGLFDHLQSSPSPSPSPIQFPKGSNSHILALLRGSTQFPYYPGPNPNPNPISTIFSALKPDLGFDPYGAPSSIGSSTRSNHHHQPNGFGFGGPEFVQNNNGDISNIQDLYQRLKSSPSYSYYCNENPGVILGNVMGSSTTSSSSSAMNFMGLEAPSMGGGGGGGDNNNMAGGHNFMNSSSISSWTDFPTVPINGAFP